MSSSLQKVKEACVQLKAAVTSSNPDNSKAAEFLEELKVMLYCYSSRPFFSCFILITSPHFISLHYIHSIQQGLLLDFDSLPPMSMDSASANEERQLACEIFEYGVLASINSGSASTFTLHHFLFEKRTHMLFSFHL